MVDDVAMDGVFHALASGARRDMVARLADGPLTVGQLAAPLDMSLAAAAKHVQVLERAGVISRTIDGRRHICRLVPGPLASAQEWLEFYRRHWSERLDALEQLLAEDFAEPGAEPGAEPATAVQPTPAKEQ